MFYHILADLVIVIHLIFILFVILGALPGIRWRWILWIHIPAFIWGVSIELGGWVCPLTPLEQWLRGMSDRETYTAGFIEYYIGSLIYPPGLTRNMQYGIAAFVLLINMVIYSYIFLRWSRLKRS